MLRLWLKIHSFKHYHVTSTEKNQYKRLNVDKHIQKNPTSEKLESVHLNKPTTIL